MNLLSYVEKLSKVEKERFRLTVESISIPEYSEFDLTKAEIQMNKELFHYYRLSIKSSAKMMKAIANNETPHKKDTLRSLFYPANPSVHPMTNLPGMKIGQNVLLLLIDSKVHGDKYTATELQTILDEVDLFYDMVTRILKEIQ